MEYKVDYKAPTTTESDYSTASKAVKDLEDKIFEETLIENEDYLLALWDKNHCIGYAVSETFPKMFISIDWLKDHLPKDEDYIRVKGYPTLPEDDLMNMAYDNGFYDGWEAFRRAILKDTLEEWREAND